MTESKQPTHPRVSARWAAEEINIVASFAPEAERARVITEYEAAFEAQWGEDKMPALIAQYERDLAAWEAEQAEQAEGDE